MLAGCPGCRFLADLADAIGAEYKTLMAYNFPLNKTNNVGSRPIQLPGGKRVGDYPVMDDELGLFAAAILHQLEFNGKQI
jgi:hypothetical protein